MKQINTQFRKSINVNMFAPESVPSCPAPGIMTETNHRLLVALEELSETTAHLQTELNKLGERVVTLEQCILTTDSGCLDVLHDLLTLSTDDAAAVDFKLIVVDKVRDTAPGSALYKAVQQEDTEHWLLYPHSKPDVKTFGFLLHYTNAMRVVIGGELGNTAHNPTMYRQRILLPALTGEQVMPYLLPARGSMQIVGSELVQNCASGLLVFASTERESGMKNYNVYAQLVLLLALGLSKFVLVQANESVLCWANTVEKNYGSIEGTTTGERTRQNCMRTIIDTILTIVRVSCVRVATCDEAAGIYTTTHGNFMCEASHPSSLDERIKCAVKLCQLLNDTEDMPDIGRILIIGYMRVVLTCCSAQKAASVSRECDRITHGKSSLMSDNYMKSLQLDEQAHLANPYAGTHISALFHAMSFLFASNSR